MSHYYNNYVKFQVTLGQKCTIHIWEKTATSISRLTSSAIKEHWHYYPAQEVFLFLFRGAVVPVHLVYQRFLAMKACFAKHMRGGGGGLMIFNKAGFAVVGSMATPKRAW